MDIVVEEQRQKNFVRVEGTLKLPLDFSNSVDDGIQGVFPELF